MHGNRYTYTEADKNRVYELLLQKKSYKEIAEITGIYYRTVIKWIKEKGLIQEIQNGCKFKNHHYFDKIDTEKKAYFFGFLLADGCIYNNALKICIHIKDKDIIDLFLKELDSKNEPTIYKSKAGTISYQIGLTSKILCNDLAKHGMVEGKNNRFIKDISDNLYRHFLRGYFDADGTVNITYRNTKTKGKKMVLRSNICGQMNMLETFKEYLSKINILGNIHFKKSIYYLDFTSIDSEYKLYKYLYKDSTIYLLRKKKRFDIFFKDRNFPLV